MTRLEAQARTRDENAAHLTSLLKEIPGIAPARMYEGCTRNAYHLYMFRYDAAAFSGLPRAAFLKALARRRRAGVERVLAAEQGAVPGGRARGRAASRRIYAKPRLDQWRDQNRCPQNDRLCSEAIWMGQTMLLGPRQDMEDIAEAIRKVQAHAPQLAREATA